MDEHYEEESINRNSFVFYDSFYRAMEYLDDEEKIEYIDAICNYSLYDIRIEMSPKIEGMFELVKANIDANIKKRKDGKKGGRPPKVETPKSDSFSKQARSMFSLIDDNE